MTSTVTNSNFNKISLGFEKICVFVVLINLGYFLILYLGLLFCFSETVLEHIHMFWNISITPDISNVQMSS